MRRSSMVLGALASLLAPVAGVFGYQSWAPGPARAVDSPAATSAPTDAATPGIRYRPCPHGAKLVGGACVIHRVRVVVAPPIAAAPAPAPVAAHPEAVAVPPADASTGHAHPSSTQEVGNVVEPSSPSAPPDCAELQDEQSDESSDDCGWSEDHHEDGAGEDSDGSSGEEG